MVRRYEDLILVQASGSTCPVDDSTPPVTYNRENRKPSALFVKSHTQQSCIGSYIYSNFRLQRSTGEQQDY